MQRLFVLVVALCHFTSLAQNDFFPRFHVRPPSNWINDPNGPVYFNGIYHLFNQYNPYAPVWGSMSWSHAVSLDNIHFTYTEVALYPDQPYDKDGVYSGSISVVNDIPIISYTCVSPQGQLQCLARPSNPKDPFLTVWIKDSSNPVIDRPPPGGNGNFRDDTTAWVDSTGQNWLMGVGSQINGNTAAISLYKSSDFRSFTFSNFLWNNTNGGMWECPDFFPLSHGKYAAKYSDSGDWITVGNYDSQNRLFIPTGDTIMLDYGQFYASKSFFDKPNNRQIVCGWVAEEGPIGNRNWASTNSLGRVVLYNPLTERVETPPLPEYSSLRTRILSSLGLTQIPRDSYTMINNAQGLMLEIEAYFQVPNMHNEFGIAVLATSSGSQQTRVGFRFSPEIGPLDNTDEPGGDYYDYPLPSSISDSINAQNCSDRCDKDVRCLAWTYVRNGFPAPPPNNFAPRCSLKSSIPNQVQGAKCCISGVKGGLTLSVNRTNSGGNGDRGSRTAPITLLTNENVLKLHVFVDHSIVEAFGQNGRSAISARVYPTDPQAFGVALYATESGTTLINATVYALENALIDHETLIKQWKQSKG